MKYSDWVDEERGRASKLAAFFSMSLSAISQWKRNGVPPEKMKSVRDFTGGVVTLEEMLPEPKKRRGLRANGAPPIPKRAMLDAA